MHHRDVSAGTRALAHVQRRAPTRAEEMLWRELRARRLDGHKFRRQVPLGPYVADFLCHEARLIVELDGPPHDDPARQTHDARRTAWLASQGYRVLRVSNDRLLGGSGDLVLDAIRRAVDPSSDLRWRGGHLLPQGEKDRRAGRVAKILAAIGGSKPTRATSPRQANASLDPT